MVLTAKITNVAITVRESNHVEVEDLIRFYRDGKEIASAVDRYVIAPDDDVESKTDRAAVIAKAARTATSDETEIAVDPVRTR